MQISSLYRSAENRKNFRKILVSYLVVFDVVADHVLPNDLEYF